MIFFYSAAEETTVQEFLSSMQDVVSSKLNLFSEEDEKKDKKGKLFSVLHTAQLSVEQRFALFLMASTSSSQSKCQNCWRRSCQLLTAPPPTVHFFHRSVGWKPL